VEKEASVPSSTTRIQLQTSALANQATGSLWKTPESRVWS
jgi:hypothetical protein